jgi:hypothetical protein
MDENFVLKCYYHSSVFPVGSNLRWKKHKLIPLCVPSNQTLDSGAVCMNSDNNVTYSFALLRFGKISSQSNGMYKCRRKYERGTDVQQVNVKVVRRNSAPPVFIDLVENVSDLYNNSKGYVGVQCMSQSLTDRESDMNLSVVWKDEGGLPISNQAKKEMPFQNGSILYYPANSGDIGTSTCEVSSSYYKESVTRRYKWLNNTARTKVTVAPRLTSGAVKQPEVMSSLIPTSNEIPDTMPGAASKQSTNDGNVVIASLSLTGCLSLVLVVIVVCYCKKRSPAVVWREPKVRLSIKQRQAEKKLLWLQMNAAAISKDQIQLVRIVGNGFFGVVSEALVKDLTTKEIQTRVAVKLINDDANMEANAYDCLIEEAIIMKRFGGHEHVISLLGICRQQSQLWLIMEFAEHGNLRAYLRQKRSSSKTLDGGNTSTNLCLNTETTLKFALQIALGMEHLSAHKCIHRDLAARNVLVFNGEKLKISDFGLAKDMHYQEYYRKTSSGVVPVKWTAPEAMIHKKYSQASDVYVYACLVDIQRPQADPQQT